MKHAGGDALNRLEPLLAKLRQFKSLKEKGRGVFYLRSSAFIHFHEDPSGLYVDVKDGPEWVRLPVNTRSERNALISKLRLWQRERKKPADDSGSTATIGSGDIGSGSEARARERPAGNDDETRLD